MIRTVTLAVWVTLVLPSFPLGALAAPKKPAARLDPSGDALPTGALFRLGTTRLRHPSRIQALVFAPDGKTLTSSDYDGRIRLWEVQTGKLRLELAVRPGQHNVFAPGTGAGIAFTPDGAALAVADRPGEVVRLFDPVSGKVLRDLSPLVGAWLAFSPDGKRMFGMNNQNQLLLCETATGKVIHRLEGFKRRVQSLAFSPDGKAIAAGDDAGAAGAISTVVVWDAASGKERCRMSDPKQGWVRGLAFSPDGKLLASATPYHACVWDAHTGKRLTELDRRARNRVFFDPSGKRLITGGDVCVWDVGAKKLIRGMGQDYNFAEVAALSPDGKTVASSAVYDERIRLWDVATGRERLAEGGHLDEVRSVCFSPDGKRIATGSGGDGTIRLWDTASGKESAVRQLKEERNHFSRERNLTVAFSPDGRFVQAAGRRWDVATGREVPHPSASVPWGRVMAHSLDGRLIALSDRYAGVSVRDAEGRMLYRLPFDRNELIRGGGVQGLAFSPDARLLATGFAKEDRLRRLRRDARPASDSVQLWDVTTGKLRRTLRPSFDAPAFLVFSPDSTLLATSRYWKDPPQLWDVASGREVCKLTGHEEQRHWAEFNPVAFSPDGALLATGGKGNTIVLWETASGKEVRVLRGHERPVRSLAFSPDGRLLVSGGGDTTALVWPVSPIGGEAIRPEVWVKATPTRLWDALAGAPAEAYPALWALIAAPDRAVALLRERLQADEVVDADRLARLVADLRSSKFGVRQQAMRELRRLGVRAETALRRGLEGKPELEMRRRIEELLAALEARTSSPEELRDLRAVQALERIGTPPAEAALEKLARGADDGPRTRAARGALVRLELPRQKKRRPALGGLPTPRGRAPRRVHAHDGPVHAVVFTPDGKTALSAGQDGKVRRSDLRGGKELPPLAGHPGGAYALAVAADGNRVATGGADGKVRLWDLATGRLKRELAGHKGAVFTVAFNGDGRLVASGGADGTLRLWDSVTGQAKGKVRVTRGQVTSVAFLPDGKKVAVGSIGNQGSTFDGRFVPNLAPETVRLWLVDSGKDPDTLRQKASGVSFSRDGRLAILGKFVAGWVINSSDEGPLLFLSGDVLLVDVATGKTRLRLEGCGSAADLSPDSRLLATALGSNFSIGGKARPETRAPALPPGLRLWETHTGRQVLSFPGDTPTTVKFSPDGTHLLIGTGDGGVFLTETDPAGVKETPRGNVTRAELVSLWEDLGGEAPKAYRAVRILSGMRGDALKFLKEKLLPSRPDDPRLRRLIAELEADRYVVRQTALAELSGRGALAAPALKAALKTTKSLQVRRRLDELLASPNARQVPNPLGRQRAAWVLENINTPSSRQLLGQILTGSK
jgi:WD40 repeat protein